MVKLYLVDILKMLFFLPLHLNYYFVLHMHLHLQLQHKVHKNFHHNISHHHDLQPRLGLLYKNLNVLNQQFSRASRIRSSSKPNLIKNVQLSSVFANLMSALIILRQRFRSGTNMHFGGWMFSLCLTESMMDFIMKLGQTSI